jgi:tetratricopeptide (TPR) repeat protein
MVMHSPNKEDKFGKAIATAATSTLRGDLLSRASNFRESGQYLEAQSIYKQILTSNPLDVNALFGLGLLAQKLKQKDVATTIFEKIIDLDDTFYLAFFQRGLMHSQNKKYKLAISDFNSTLTIKPDLFEALSNRGIAFSKCSNFDAAHADFCAAVKLRPNSADAYYNRALACINLEKIDLAIADYTKAITHNPNHFQALNNRGMALRELRRFNEAIEDFENCVALKPDFADGYWNKALTHLMIGDYENAWPLYEHRWDSPNFTSKKRDFEKPLWLGSPSLNGKTILLHSEQGLGDSLQFCRYIEKFRELQCKVLLEVEKPLMRIMENLLPAKQIFEKGADLPAFDFHCPLMSLPLAFQTTVATIPSPSPYLSGNSDRIKWWQDYLGEAKKPRVGLVWQGNPHHSKNQRRSIQLSNIIRYLEDDFDWYSLQMEVSSEDECIINKTRQLTHFGALIGDFAETAALCATLDAIVSVDTSIVHLCGAIGKPVHLLLSYIADARWHADGDSTPWYPTICIYRQGMNRCWHEPIHQAISEIKKSYSDTK